MEALFIRKNEKKTNMRIKLFATNSRRFHEQGIFLLVTIWFVVCDQYNKMSSMYCQHLMQKLQVLPIINISEDKIPPEIIKLPQKCTKLNAIKLTVLFTILLKFPTILKNATGRAEKVSVCHDRSR